MKTIFIGICLFGMIFCQGLANQNHNLKSNETRTVRNGPQSTTEKTDMTTTIVTETTEMTSQPVTSPSVTSESLTSDKTPTYTSPVETPTVSHSSSNDHPTSPDKTPTYTYPAETSTASHSSTIDHSTTTHKGGSKTSVLTSISTSSTSSTRTPASSTHWTFDAGSFIGGTGLGLIALFVMYYAYKMVMNRRRGKRQYSRYGRLH